MATQMAAASAGRRPSTRTPGTTRSASSRATALRRNVSVNARTPNRLEANSTIGRRKTETTAARPGTPNAAGAAATAHLGTDVRRPDHRIGPELRRSPDEPRRRAVPPPAADPTEAHRPVRAPVDR